MSVDIQTNKTWKALQRGARALVQVGSRALRDAKPPATKSATITLQALRSTWDELTKSARLGAQQRSDRPRERASVDAAPVSASPPAPASDPIVVSRWKTAMLIVLSVMFVISLAYMMTVRTGAWSGVSTSTSAPRTMPTGPTTPALGRTDAARTATPVAHPMATEVTEEQCHARLRDSGVTFEQVDASDAPGVAWPIKLTSAVDGILIHGGNNDAPTNYLDCRLALALLAWAPSLRDQGVVGLEHYSAYRRDAVVAGTTTPSGHAIGSAIDIGRFEMRDGRKLSVLDDWTNRDRGADPCQAWPTDSDATRIMRKLVCDAFHAELFQTVITPHYNDAHKNHVHLEIAPQSEGAWMG